MVTVQVFGDDDTNECWVPPFFTHLVFTRHVLLSQSLDQTTFFIENFNKLAWLFWLIIIVNQSMWGLIWRCKINRQHWILVDFSGIHLLLNVTTMSAAICPAPVQAQCTLLSSESASASLCMVSVYQRKFVVTSNGSAISFYGILDWGPMLCVINTSDDRHVCISLSGYMPCIY